MIKVFIRLFSRFWQCMLQSSTSSGILGANMSNIYVTAEELMIAEAICWEFLEKTPEAAFVRKRCVKECEQLTLVERVSTLLDIITNNDIIGKKFESYVEESTRAEKDNKANNKANLDKDTKVPNKD